jgi:predicted nucleotidyltransferase
MVQIRELLSRLNSAGVEYVVIGGVAARLHGSTLRTDDLDVCCAMTEPNMAKLLSAIGALRPIFRNDPRRIPLPTTATSLARFNTMLLQTDLGAFDVLREVTGVGGYDEVAKHTTTVDIGGQHVRILDLDTLIQAKTAAGRDKDRIGVMHLEAVKKRRQTPPPPPPNDP